MPSLLGSSVSHTLPLCAHSATGNSATSQSSATEPMVVSFAVTHMALHNNQELTGTVSFYCEEQRHWSCLSADVGQQRVGFHFRFLVRRVGDWHYCFMQRGWVQINDGFLKTHRVCCEQIGLVHFLFFQNLNRQVQVGQISKWGNTNPHGFFGEFAYLYICNHEHFAQEGEWGELLVYANCCFQTKCASSVSVMSVGCWGVYAGVGVTGSVYTKKADFVWEWFKGTVIHKGLRGRGVRRYFVPFYFEMISRCLSCTVFRLWVGLCVSIMGLAASFARWNSLLISLNVFSDAQSSS